MSLIIHTVYHVEETSHKRPHIVGVYLYKISRLGKSIEAGTRLVVAKGKREEDTGSDC